MKRTLADHGLKVGDEITLFTRNWRGQYTSVPTHISTVVRATKALIDLASGHHIDLRQTHSNVWPRLTTDEDREYIAKQIADKEAAQAVIKEREDFKRMLHELFPEERPLVSDGYQSGRFNVEFSNLTEAQVRDLAARLSKTQAEVTP